MTPLPPTPRATVGDLGKLVLFGLVIVVLGVLRALDAVTEQLFGAALLPMVGYVIGNGVQAMRGKAPSPVFVPREGLTRAQLDALAQLGGEDEGA